MAGGCPSSSLQRKAAPPRLEKDLHKLSDVHTRGFWRGNKTGNGRNVFDIHALQARLSSGVMALSEAFVFYAISGTKDKLNQSFIEFIGRSPKNLPL